MLIAFFPEAIKRQSKGNQKAIKRQSKNEGGIIREPWVPLEGSKGNVVPLLEALHAHITILDVFAVFQSAFDIIIHNVVVGAYIT